MGQIYPFRNVRGPHIVTPCEICGEEIEPGQGYSVIYEGCVDGYVCVDCFEEVQPDDNAQVIYRVSVN